MTTGPYTRFKRCFDDFAIAVDTLFPAAKFQLMEDMIIRAARQHTCLFEAGLFHQTKVAFDRTNPACTFGILVPQRLAALQRFTVVLCIQKEFRLPDHAVRAAQFG